MCDSEEGKYMYKGYLRIEKGTVFYYWDNDDEKISKAIALGTGRFDMIPIHTGKGYLFISRKLNPISNSYRDCLTKVRKKYRKMIDDIDKEISDCSNAFPNEPVKFSEELTFQLF